MAEKYNASNLSIDQILNFIKSGEIAIPDIQQPFVWKPKQVRDLIDSLYNGYPTGYLIISQNPDMRLKDGTRSEGKKIMIDGQQRVTALLTAILGMEVIDADFEKKRIKISFNPIAVNEEEFFKVQDNAVLKDKKWIADIAEVFKSDFKRGSFVNRYCELNPEIDPDRLHDILEDTHITVEELANEFGNEVATGVLALTKRDVLPKEDQMSDCISRIKQCEK